MISGRKPLSALMAFVLAVGLVPLPAFAADETPGTPEIPETASAAVSQDPSQAGEDPADRARAVDLSAVEFVYLESGELPAGENQNIVIGFADDALVVSDAQLVIGQSDGSALVVQQTEAVGGAVLFALETSGLAPGAYDIRELSFRSPSGELYRVDFTGDEASDYRFALVEAGDVAESSADASVEGVQIAAYTINDEGAAVETDSIADAMAAAGVDPLAGPEAPSEGNGGMTAQASDGFVVVIDPGHGGSDGGATGIGFYEKDVNLKISQYCKAALEKNPGVTVYMTRNDDTYVSLSDRVNFAIAHDADLLLCLHNNAGGRQRLGSHSAAQRLVVLRGNLPDRPRTRRQGFEQAKRLGAGHSCGRLLAR